MSEATWYGHFRDRRFWAVQVLVLVLAAVHTLVEMSHATDHLESIYFVPEALFLIPVGYAALNFGLLGSMATSLWCTFLSLPNLMIWHSDHEAPGVLFQLAVLNAVAFFIGQRVDQQVEARRELDHAHSALACSEARYRALFHASGDAMIACDQDGIIREGNLAAARMFDRPLIRLKGTNMADLVGAEGARGIIDWPHSPDPESITRDLVHRRPSGEEVWIEATCSAVAALAGETLVHASLRDVTQQRNRQQELSNFAAHMLRVQEDERRRIALELHDETLQGLILLCRRLDAIEERQPLPDSALRGLRGARQATEEMVESLRTFTTDLRPPALDDLGVVATIRRLLDDLGARTGIHWDLEVRGTARRLPPDAELGLFRIAQEAVRNVERHAGARSVQVAMAFAEKSLALSVRDDGRGFALPHGIHPTRGLGLIGMQERASLLGGSLEMQAAPGRGTTVTISIPL